jgi:hypothetical protein
MARNSLMNASSPPAWERFSPETLQALFEAVEIDDVVDPEVSLPNPIDLRCSQDEMRRGFALCLQFWSEGFRRTELAELVERLLRQGDLPSAERQRYKHIRAKYKQLRFALMLYDVHHRLPLLFHITVAIMGNLQDAFRHQQRMAIVGYGLLLRVLLSRPIWAIVKRRLLSIRFDTAQGFEAYRRAEIQRLRTLLGQDAQTGHQFHAMRKIVSRQVSFHDTRRTLCPNEHDYRMSRFLSAINGLMGRKHDEMVEQAVAGQQKYKTAAMLDPDIRQRLEELVANYPS